MKIAFGFTLSTLIAFTIACAGGDPTGGSEPDVGPEGEPAPVDNSVIPCVSEQFDELDVLTITRTYSFVRQGVGSFLVDHVNPNVADQKTTYSYDASGRLSTMETDQGLDGTPETTVEYVWDGDFVAATITTTANGTQSQVRYTYDGDLVVRTEVDSNIDGTIDQATDYVHDSEGRVVRFENDFDGDGEVDFVTSHSSSVQGNLTIERVDNGDDGTIDSERRTTVNDAGATLLYEIENFASVPGTVTAMVHTLDTENRAIRVETTRDDVLESYVVADFSCHP